MSTDPPTGGTGDDPGPDPAGGPIVDLTLSEQAALPPPLDLIQDEPYAPPRAIGGPMEGSGNTIEDKARVVLAGSLLGLLAVVVVGSGWTVLNFPDREPAVEGFLQIVFAPIVGLVGSVIGFYFGYRSASDTPRRRG